MQKNKSAKIIENQQESKEKSTQGIQSWLLNPILISSSFEKNPANEIQNPTWKLSPRTIANLKENNVSHLFPVQQAVLPILMSSRYSTIVPSDLCVSASTGSGKTLTYVIPIIETLIPRIVPRIRALVVLPTKDLAYQVKQEFTAYIKGTDLQLAIICGQTSFENEQSQLISSDSLVNESNLSSRVDIVIATPGRLIDHIKSTPGFDLSHLRFLVIDEADRLMNQSYHHWFDHLLNSSKSNQNQNQINELNSIQTFRLNSINPIRFNTPFQKLLFSATLTRNPGKIASLHLNSPKYISVSGSLENDDESRYVVPNTLFESMITCSSKTEKLGVLVYSLIQHEFKKGGVLVFCKSIESANRLSTFINIHMKRIDLNEKRVGPINEDFLNQEEDIDIIQDPLQDPINDDSIELSKSISIAISSNLTPQLRRKVLSQFSKKEISILVCSDVIARGIDLGQSVRTVINYDMPTKVKTYVHRVGRTSRAGGIGNAVSILLAKEMWWFKNEISKKIVRENAIRKIQIKHEEFDKLNVGMDRSLAQLGRLVKGNNESISSDEEEEYN